MLGSLCLIYIKMLLASQRVTAPDLPSPWDILCREMFFLSSRISRISLGGTLYKMSLKATFTISFYESTMLLVQLLVPRSSNILYIVCRTHFAL
jgi:hypothetical protein